MGSWTWMLADDLGRNLAELTTAAGKTITDRRNSYTEAGCTISYEDDAAYVLLDYRKRGVPRLKAYRDGALVFNGYLAPSTGALEEAALMTLTFRSPFAAFLGDGDAAGRYVDSYIECSSVDAGEIAASLVRLYGGAGEAGETDSTFGIEIPDHSYTGLGIGTIETTLDRDREFQRDANVGEAIVGLTTPLGGFDFETLIANQIADDCH